MRIILVLLFVLGLAYFYTDRQLYFYGKSDLKIYHPLPIKINPEFWGYDRGNLGFVFADDFDFTVVEKGKNKYGSSEVLVHEIIKYGFDKKRVVVAVLDSLGHEHSITLESGDKNELEASVDAKSEFEDLNWMDIKGKDDYVKTLVWIRSIIRIVLLVLIVVIGVKVVRASVQRVNRPTTTMT